MQRERGCDLPTVVDLELKRSFNLHSSSVTWGVCSPLPKAPPFWGQVVASQGRKALGRRQSPGADAKGLDTPAHRLPFRWLSWWQTKKRSPHFCALSPQVSFRVGSCSSRKETFIYSLLLSQNLLVSKTRPQNTNCIEWMERSSEGHSKKYVPRFLSYLFF